MEITITPGAATAILILTVAALTVMNRLRINSVEERLDKLIERQGEGDDG